MLDTISALSSITPSAAAICICTMINVLATFVFYRKIAAPTVSLMRPLAFAFALLDGIIYVYVRHLGVFVSPVVSVPMLSFAVAAEFFILSYDSPLLQSYLFFLSMLINAAMTSFSQMAIGLAAPDLQLHVPEVSLFMSAFIMLIMSSARSFPVEQLADLLFSRERGMLMFMYVLLCDISVLSTVKYTDEILLSISSEVLTQNHLIVLAIKDVLTLISCFLIALLQGKTEGRFRMSSLLFASISKDREFHRLAHGRVIASYSANITKNTFEESIGKIKPQFGSTSDYSAAVKNFIDNVAHPGDRNELYEKVSESFCLGRLESGPTFSFRFRISPEAIMRMMALPDDTARKYSTGRKEWAYVAANCVIVKDEMSGDIHIFVYLIDVDADMSQYEDMRHSASYDALTGIANRKTLESTITAALRDVRHSGALFIIDLDNFKSVNDILGHPAGDRVLCETADLIRAEFRSADIVGRLGGDEFMAYSIGVMTREDAEKKALRLVQRGARLIDVPDGEPIRVSFSIGVSLFPAHGTDYDTLYKAADSALYRSKTAGKDCFTLCDIR